MGTRCPGKLGGSGRKSFEILILAIVDGKVLLVPVKMDKYLPMFEEDASFALRPRSFPRDGLSVSPSSLTLISTSRGSSVISEEETT